MPSRAPQPSRTNPPRLAAGADPRRARRLRLAAARPRRRPQHIDSLHIGGRITDRELLRELERDLDALGIARKASATQAQYSLIFLDQKSKRRTATLSGRARTAELELIEEIQFTLLANDGSEVIPPATVRDDRVFEYNEDDVLATDDEARLVRGEMRASLVRQIIGYLQRVGPRPPANAPAP